MNYHSLTSRAAISFEPAAFKEMIPYEAIVSEVFTFDRFILELLLWLSQVKGKPLTIVYINHRFVGVCEVVTVAFREGGSVRCS